MLETLPVVVARQPTPVGVAQRLEALPVVVAPQRGLADVGRRLPVCTRLWGLLRHVQIRLQWATLFLPWLLCLPHADSYLGWISDQQIVLGVGLLLMAVSGAAALRDHLRSGGGAAPLLAAIALLLWHLGFHSPASSPSEKWCVAVLRDDGGELPLSRVDRHHAAVGLMLLDDMLRTILRFVAGAPSEAWPFALASQEHYFLWVCDEEWWETCYHRTNWMRLPAHPKRMFGGPRSSSRVLLTEAMLWASMAMETLGTMVILPPKCAGSGWAAAPCVAVTLLVVSCAPWLPRQSDVVLVEMLQLIRMISRFAIYFQVIWLVVIGLLLAPEEIALCALAKDSPTLLGLQAAALVVLYVMVASHLWVTTTRCRVASPLYAVRAEDVVSDVPLRSRPLYCGSTGPHGAGLGLVEGSHAPTRMCDWEDPAVASLRWRDRLALRHCAESLASREAHLLSNLDALDVCISEAELEVHGTSHAPRPGSARQRSLNGVLAVLAVALCLLASRGWRPSCCAQPAAVSSDSCTTGFLESVVWAFLLLRVGHCWYSILVQSAAAWEASGRTAYAEVVTLRQQASTLYRSLAETQWMLSRLEAQLESLGVVLAKKERRADRTAAGEVGEGNVPSPLSAMRVIMLGWLGSVVALALVPLLQ